MKVFMRTQNDYGLFFARIALAFAMFPHGAQKALGWFDGNGMGETIKHFEAMNIPAWAGYCAIAAEFLGSIALALGFLGRFAALGIGATMAFAAWKVKLADGEFMGWWIKDGGGLEGGFHVLAIGIAIAIVLRGSGALSIDRSLSARD